MKGVRTEEFLNAVAAYKALPLEERRRIDRAQRSNKLVMSKIDGTLFEEVELIMKKKSKLNRFDRAFVLSTVNAAFKLMDNAENKD